MVHYSSMIFLTTTTLKKTFNVYFIRHLQRANRKTTKFWPFRWMGLLDICFREYLHHDWNSLNIHAKISKKYNSFTCPWFEKFHMITTVMYHRNVASNFHQFQLWAQYVDSITRFPAENVYNKDYSPWLNYYFFANHPYVARGSK